MLSRLMLRGGLLAVVFGVFLLVAPGQQADADEKVLKAVAPWPLPFPLTEPLIWFKDRINEELEGEVRIDYLGASEVVPAFEQFQALQDGVIDVILTATAYYKGSIPVARAGLYSNMSVADRRESGFYDLMRKIHMEKADVVYLAHVGGPVGGFRLYTKDQPKSPPDFTGMKFRGGGVYSPLIGHYGGTTVLMKPSEAYAALERGVVDGFGWSTTGVADRALHEVSDYVIDHAFASVDDPILVRGEVWRGLTDAQRAVFEKIAVEIEHKTEQVLSEAQRTEDAKLKELGMKFHQYAPADAAEYVKVAHEAGWADVIKDDPDLGPQFRKLGFRE